MKRNLFNQILLTFVLVISSKIRAGESELIIPLRAAQTMLPIYASRAYLVNTPLGKEYVEGLREVLLFDLNQNGTSFVESSSIEEEEMLKSATPFPLSFWKTKGHAFIIKMKIEGDKMMLSLFSVRAGARTDCPAISLSGMLASDRRVMHKVADKIHEIMIGKKGIASTRLLYAKQLPLQTDEGIEWRSEIWSVDYDGGNAKQLTQENSYCISPTIFPSRGRATNNKFLYVNYKLGQPKVYITSFDSPRGTPYLTLRGNQLLPTISKQGDLIAFISDASGRADLFVQSFHPDQGLTGKPIQVYSYPNSVQASPTFSPDGKKIAFVSDKEGTPRIYLIDTPKSARIEPKLTCLTKRFRGNTCPAWSPDGTKLAYSAMVEGVRQIMIYDFLTKEETQLTTGRSHKENPSWAPNSMHIVCNTVDPSASELFLINLKQKKMVQITTGTGRKHYPTWEAF